MSSARQGLSIIGQLAGLAISGPIAGVVGGIIGGEVGGVIDGPPEGPRLDDLSAPQVQFGGKIPRLYGGPKWFEVGGLWMSEKTEHSEVVGGKGGDSGQEQFSYTCNMLLRVTESREGTPCEILAVTGVEVDGVLEWTALADADAESLANSQATELWSSMTVLTGSETQSPWSVYEAAVGASNANAYRGYCTVGFENFQLAPNGMPRRIRIQCITAGTMGGSPVLLQSNFGDDLTDDVSCYASGPASSGPTDEAAIVSEVFTIATPVDPTDTLMGELIYLESQISGAAAVPIIVEGFISIGDSPNLSSIPVLTYHSNTSDANTRKSIEVSRVLGVAKLGYNDAGFGLEAYTDLPPAIEYVAMSFGPSGTSIYVGNTRFYYAAGDSTPISGTVGRLTLGAPSYLGSFEGVGEITVHSFRVRSGELTGATIIPPNGPDFDLPVCEIWTPSQVPLRDILEYEAGERCAPLTLANLDFSAADGLMVDCHVGIGSAAEVMQPLLTRFWFDLFSADKLTLVRRGGDVEQTIPFRWTGSGNGGRSAGFAGLIRGNDVEVPKKKAVTYSDILKDGESDTRTGDRESVGSAVDTLSMNLNMLPSEAQGLADTATWDARIAGHTATITVGARHGLLLQPGSVFTGIDHHGNEYRLLARRIVWDRWVWTVDVRLDDPTVLRAAGIAVDLDQRALTVAPLPEATLYVLDIPLLRLEDDGPGEYVAVTCTGRWRGATLHKSSDDVTYSQVGAVVNRATAGDCDSTLPAFTGWGWDNSSVLTVTLDDGSGGTLSSATKTAIEASRSLNLAAVGAHGRWELVQFATATLLTGSTYELTGILRNLWGTEWANGLHGDDSFVLLTTALGRIPGAVSDMGQTRHYKAVPAGRSVAGVDAESIVCEEQCLLSYAPVDVMNDAGTIRWNRRSRIEGAVGIDPPIGEASERYDAEVYTGVTLDDSASALTSPAWTPGSDPSGKTAKVYQLSELAGRGHEAEAELT